MANKCIRPIKTIAIFTNRSSSAWLVFVPQPISRLTSGTRECLYSVAWWVQSNSSNLSESGSLIDLWQDGYSSTAFLPVMASDYSFTTYKLELLKNCWVHRFAFLVLEDIVYARMYWQWVGPKFHSLLSAHHLIGPHFLTTDNDKHMHLLTRLYGTCFLLLSKV